MVKLNNKVYIVQGGTMELFLFIFCIILLLLNLYTLSRIFDIEYILRPRPMFRQALQIRSKENKKPATILQFRKKDDKNEPN